MPDPGTWLAFAKDTLQRTSINSVSAYATLLNKASAQLADHLGSGHQLHVRLTANLRKPWLGDDFDKHSSWYAAERAALAALVGAAREGTAVVRDEHRVHVARRHLHDRARSAFG